MIKTRPILAIVFLAAALAACGTSREQKPQGIGERPDELKRSPCACVEIPQDIPAALLKT